MYNRDGSLLGNSQNKPNFPYKIAKKCEKCETNYKPTAAGDKCV